MLISWEKKEAFTQKSVPLTRDFLVQLAWRRFHCLEQKYGCRDVRLNSQFAFLP